MKLIRLLFTTLILGLFSCGQNSNDKKTNTTKTMYLSEEKWTIYKLEDTIVHIKRFLSCDTGLTLLYYEINISEPEAAKQTLINTESLADEQAANRIKLESADFNWTPYKEMPTLFVQIEGSVFKDEYEAILRRQGLEKSIETALQTNKLGQWTGGDVGPGGANMLFEVNNIDKAISTIIDVLKKSGLDKKTIIGRRINTDAEDWFYEVIYPTNFNGDFITM